MRVRSFSANAEGAFCKMHAVVLCREGFESKISWCFGGESWMAKGRCLALACAKASGNGLARRELDGKGTF